MDQRAVIAVELELTLVCRGCEARVALPGVVPEATCGRCQRKVPLPASSWRAMLADPLREAPALAENEERDGIHEGPEGTVRRVYRRTALRCHACRAPLGDAPATGTPWTCAACGHGARTHRDPAVADALFVDEPAAARP